MAKKTRQQFTSENGLNALLETINKVALAELGQLSPEDAVKAKAEGLAAVQNMTNIIGNSNMRTSVQLQDDAIEQYHQVMEQAEAEAAAAGQAEQAEQQDNTPQLETDPEPNF